MKSITELSQAQREALRFWALDAAGSKDPITVCDPHNYLSKFNYGKDGLSMENIPQETRRESYAAVTQDTAARRRVILEMLTEHGGMTAREIAVELQKRGITPTDERNYAAPRLSELLEAGKIEAVDTKICDHSGRSVAVWAAKG